MVPELKTILITNGFTLAATLLSSYLLFRGNKSKSDADLVATLLSRVENLEQRISEQNEEITQLRLALEKKYEGSVILKAYLQDKPYAAWIKLMDTDDDGNPRFTMWHINPQYEQWFGIKNARYVGNTDFDLWPEDVAQRFYENDCEVLSKMDHTCKSEQFPRRPLEPVSRSNPIVQSWVCKWPTRVNGQIAIAGQIIEKPTPPTEPEVT